MLWIDADTLSVWRRCVKSLFPANSHILIEVPYSRPPHILTSTYIFQKAHIMVVLSFLEILCLFSVYLIRGAVSIALPPNQVLDDPGSLTIVPANASFSKLEELCTNSLIWKGGTKYDNEFSSHCFQAWQTFLSTDMAKYKGLDFEFLHQGAPPSFSGIPKVATPRRYVNSESNLHLEGLTGSLTNHCLDSCTIAIANMADIPKGILPDQPPGPFPKSDVGRFHDLRASIKAVRLGCLARKQASGYAIAGKCILYLGWRHDMITKMETNHK